MSTISHFPTSAKLCPQSSINGHSTRPSVVHRVIPSSHTLLYMYILCAQILNLSIWAFALHSLKQVARLQFPANSLRSKANMNIYSHWFPIARWLHGRQLDARETHFIFSDDGTPICVSSCRCFDSAVCE